MTDHNRFDPQAPSDRYTPVKELHGVQAFLDTETGDFVAQITPRSKVLVASSLTVGYKSLDSQIEKVVSRRKAARRPRVLKPCVAVDAVGQVHEGLMYAGYSRKKGDEGHRFVDRSGRNAYLQARKLALFPGTAEGRGRALLFAGQVKEAVTAIREANARIESALRDARITDPDSGQYGRQKDELGYFDWTDLRGYRHQDLDSEEAQAAEEVVQALIDGQGTCSACKEVRPIAQLRDQQGRGDEGSLKCRNGYGCNAR